MWTGACITDHLCPICLTSAQISSFSVSPNYELLFFSSELDEVVNILDFFDGQPVDLEGELKNFEVNGGLSVSETHWNKKGSPPLSVHTCFPFQQRSTQGRTWTLPSAPFWSGWLSSSNESEKRPLSSIVTPSSSLQMVGLVLSHEHQRKSVQKCFFLDF